jgi:citrate/tricarballylate utilization protein
MHATPDLAEADRLMVVCNSCRYCEGLCAVFPAMEMRYTFADGDLDYLANLCHACGACYHDCQFSPPHEFAVNVPKTLATVRAQSYGRYAWPAAMAPAFERNGVAMAVAVTLGVVVFVAGFAATGSLFGRHLGTGAFYTWMAHNTMAWLFGVVFVAALVAMGMGLRNFWRATGEPVSTLTDRRWLWQAGKDAASLRYLDGGGVGCMNHDERPNDTRRMWHHFTAYGFMLCFASTSTATLYHYLLGREAPYPWWDLPVVLGTLGGIGLVVGSVGLLEAKRRRYPALRDESHRGMEIAFLAMLLATGVTGLTLLLFRATGAMGTLLAIHLGVVLALFATMPFGKFVHGIYRFAALVRAARERHTMAHG